MCTFHCGLRATSARTVMLWKRLGGSSAELRHATCTTFGMGGSARSAWRIAGRISSGGSASSAPSSSRALLLLLLSAADGEDDDDDDTVMIPTTTMMTTTRAGASRRRQPRVRRMVRATERAG
eukprot:5945152-Prymnesium_polylepis.1